jgi:hypothetical protein
MPDKEVIHPTHFITKADKGEGMKCVCKESSEAHNFTINPSKIDCPHCKSYLALHPV